MGFDRILLAAPKSGSGKTVITCGLLAALKAMGLRPTAFKCGPDYIDPMFHRRVLEVESRNLDSFFLDEAALRRSFRAGAGRGDMAVIEGVMGYYDGLGGISPAASAFDVGRITASPVILVVDGRGASLSLAAQVKGFLDYMPESGIRGVIFNRVSPALCSRLAPAVERLGVRVFGCVPEEGIFSLESRHLGLKFPDAPGDEALRSQLEAMGRRLAETLDMNGILKLAAEAPKFPEDAAEDGKREPSAGTWKTQASRALPVTIGVAMDEAFCFYYEENLELLRKFGAALKFFSPLRDGELPEDIDGLLLGGGYPEAWAKELSENASMRRAVRRAEEGGLPILAECGGFLYLHRTLQGEDGEDYPMAGCLPLTAVRGRKLSRFGYIEILTEDGETLRGHEFHYWESEDPGSLWQAKKPLSARGWSCEHGRNGGYWGFPHIYYPANPQWVRRWLKRCREYGAARRQKDGDQNDA